MVFNMTAILSKAEFPMIAIYKHPADFPDKYVARLWDLDKPTALFFAADTYEELMKEIPTRIMQKIPRWPDDAQAVMEVWM